MILRSLIVSLSFVLICSRAALAADSPLKSPPAGFTHVRTEGKISEYRLEANGLTVLLLPDRSTPVVTFMITYRVGSRNESYGTTGATHLLEHLMFKGTHAYYKEAGNGFDQLLERTGAITNATTWLDRTNYFETVPAQHLPLAVKLEADRMRNLRLREEDRRPEMTVVRNEYERGENSTSERLEKEIWATAFLAHPYHHSTIGWRSDFEKVPIEKLREFYDTFYWPNNATVSIIGDFEPAAALALVKEHYAKIPRAAKPLPEVYTEEPEQTGERRVTIKGPGELGRVTLAHKIPPGTHGDFAPLRVLDMILTDGRNSRMYQALTDKNLTTEVTAASSFNRDPTLHLISAELTPDTKHGDVEQKMLAEVSRVQEGGVTPTEVAAAIAKLTTSTAFSRDGSFAMASELNECIAVGDWTMYYKLDELIRKVTPADVQRVAKAYFREERRTVGWFVPKEVEATPSEEKQVSNATESTPAATTATATTAKGAVPARAPEPSNGALASAVKVVPQIVRSRVAGIDVMVCPANVQDVVTIVGNLPAFDGANPVLVSMTAEMLERGTAKHDAKTIAALLDEVGATLEFSVDAGYVQFAARCLKKDVPRVVGLLAEQLREPTFPQEEFEKLRTQKIADTEQLREDTGAQAAIAFFRAVFPVGHPHYELTCDEAIAALKRLSVVEVKKFHGEWFGPAHSKLVAVGDVEAAKMQAEIGKAFAGWKGGRTLPAITLAKPLPKSSQVTVAVPGKESLSVVIGQPAGLKYTDPDHLPLVVATTVLGHGFTSRLVGTVRDTEGLTYGIGATVAGSGPFDRAWAINATFAPSLLAKGLASTRRELNGWREKGITAAELDYRKSALAGAHQVRLATSAGLAGTILDTVNRGLELSWIDEYPAKVAAVSLSQVNDVVRRRVDPGTMISVIAGSTEAK